VEFLHTASTTGILAQFCKVIAKNGHFGESWRCFCHVVPDGIAGACGEGRKKKSFTQGENELAEGGPADSD